MPEAPPPVPQNISSELAKAAVLPEVLKNAPIAWERVRKVDGMLDKIPEINARGGKIEVDKQVDAEKMRKSTKIKVGEKDTNLVDYVTDDEQLRIMLQEGIRLNSGIITEQDLQDMHLVPKNFQRGEKAGLELPPLRSRLQKAEVISLILHRLGKANSTTTSQYLDEVSKLMFDRKKVDFQRKGVFSNLTLLNALAAGGREELSQYIVEQGYRPYALKPDENLAQRQIMAKLVKEAYGEEKGVSKILTGETPIVVDRKEGVLVPEYSALIDIHVAKAITNVMMPAEFHVAIAGLENQVRTAGTVVEAQELRHRIGNIKRNVFAGLLNAFNVQGYETDGEVYRKLGFTVGDQVEIARISQVIKESRNFKEAQNLTMWEANRISLAQVAAEITGVNADKMRAIVLGIPIEEQNLENLRERGRSNLIGEDFVERNIREQISESFIQAVTKNAGEDLKRVLTDVDKALLKKFFLEMYDTERSLVKKAYTIFKDADAPTKMKIGTPEAINQGIKGLDFLFRNSIREQQYDWETYKQLVIEGAAQAEIQVPGAVLEQGKAAEEKYAKDWDEAHGINREMDRRLSQEKAQAAEEEARQAEEEARQAEIAATEAAIKAEEKYQQERTEFLNRKPSESLVRENIQDFDQEETYVNELMQKIDQGVVGSEEILDEMNAILNIPKGSENMFRGPIRFIKEKGLKDPAKKETYKQLKSALAIGRQFEAIPGDYNTNRDEIEEARKQFFVPPKEEEKEEGKVVEEPKG